MTLLRRIAQLVQDLRTLNLLAEEDYVHFMQSKDSIKLRIGLDKDIHKQLDADILSIENAIRAEFTSEDGVEYDEIKIFVNKLYLTVKCW